MRAAARDGAGVVVYSSDLDEVLSLATRVVVLHDGRLRDRRRRPRRRRARDVGGRVTAAATTVPSAVARRFASGAVANARPSCRGRAARNVAVVRGERGGADSSRQRLVASTPQQAVWLTTIVQLGFVFGTAAAALLNLADMLPSRWYFASRRIAGAVFNAAILHDEQLRDCAGAALLHRILARRCVSAGDEDGVDLVSARRGLAIGTVVGALTVGKASPYLVHALPNAGIATRDPRGVWLCAVRRIPRRRVLRGWTISVSAAPLLVGAGSLGDRELANGASRQADTSDTCSSCTRSGRGFRSSSRRASSRPGWRATRTRRRSSSLVAFGTIAIGGIGCVWGGLVADAKGRERLVMHLARAERRLRAVDSVRVRSNLWLLGAARHRVGLLRDRRLRAVQRAGHRIGSAARGRNRADGSDIDRIPAHDGVARCSCIRHSSIVVGWKWVFPVLALGPAFGIAIDSSARRDRDRSRARVASR